MGIFSDILLTVDYDRTLTDTDGVIPQRNLDAIHYFMDNGGAFTVNTGRSVPMCRPLLDKVPVNAPLLLYNGSAAYDKETGKLSLLKPIGLPQADTIREVMERFPDVIVEVQSDRAHHTVKFDQAWNDIYDTVGCARETCTLEELPEPFLKFSVLGPIHQIVLADLFQGTEEEIRYMDEVQQWLTERFADSLVVFRACARIIDLHAKGVSKIRAARDLQQALGRKILVCAGDAPNDLPMLEGADFAFCPSDGMVAERFTNVCPCGEGAVADVIYKKIPEILDLSLDIQR